MGKIRRESAPPEHNALRSRGCPSPEHDRRPVRRPRTSRSAAPVRIKGVPLGKRLAAAAGEMRRTADVVAQLKEAGQDYSSAAREARFARHRWLELQGGTHAVAIEPAGYEAPSR